jgi:hypothetical protein
MGYRKTLPDLAGGTERLRQNHLFINLAVSFTPAGHACLLKDLLTEIFLIARDPFRHLIREEDPKMRRKIRLAGMALLFGPLVGGSFTFHYLGWTGLGTGWMAVDAAGMGLFVPMLAYAVGLKFIGRFLFLFNDGHGAIGGGALNQRQRLVQVRPIPT